MWGSQALETGIGLALMFFLLATAASAITEVGATALSRRHRQLTKSLKQMLSAGGPADVSDPAVRDLLQRATGDARATYLSAKTFADAATQLVAGAETQNEVRRLGNL